MGSNISVSSDRFAIALLGILDDVVLATDENVGKAVAQSTRKGVKIVKEKAGNTGLHKWSDRYVGGFSSSIDKNGKVVTGEIGNRKEPGLVHLLEKGHATLTGRRTRAYPHMEPAYDEIHDDFIKRIYKAVGEALGS